MAGVAIQELHTNYSASQFQAASAAAGLRAQQLLYELHMPFTSLVRRLHAVLGGYAKCCLGMARCLNPPHGYLQPLQPSLSAPRGAAPGGLPTQLGSYKGRLCGWFRESPAGQHARRQKQEPETVQTPNRLLLAGDMVHEHLHAARHRGHLSCCILCGHGGQGGKKQLR